MGCPCTGAAARAPPCGHAAEKVPSGATRYRAVPRQVSPEEYREFLALGHGEIFNLDLDAVVDAPWR